MGDATKRSERYLIESRTSEITDFRLLILMIFNALIAMLGVVLACVVTGGNNITIYSDPCVPCEDGEGGHDVLGGDGMGIEMKNLREKVGKQKDCCASPDKTIKIMFQKRWSLLKAQGTFPAVKYVYFHTDEQTNDTHLVSTANPCVHLILSPSQTTESTDNNDTYNGSREGVVDWIHDKDMSFITYGLKYKAGSLYFSTSGLYHVYSQIHFMQYPNAKNENFSTSPVDVVHLSIYRRWKNQNGLVVEELVGTNRQKVVQTRDEVFHWTRFSASVVHMRAGDELYVKVLNKSMISPHSRMSYFGAFMI